MWKKLSAKFTDLLEIYNVEIESITKGWDNLIESPIQESVRFIVVNCHG